jgi:hypothetical protein
LIEERFGMPQLSLEALNEGKQAPKNVFIFQVKFQQNSGRMPFLNAPCTLVRDLHNSNDCNAIKIVDGIEIVGWVPREIARIMAPLMDSGNGFQATTILDDEVRVQFDE